MPFDKGKKRRLIDSCGHERCYDCLVQNEACPQCAANGESAPTCSTKILREYVWLVRL